MPRKLDWPRARKALKVLVADSERTDQVFEIIDALSGASFEHCFVRFAVHPDGARLLRERPSLLATLSGRAALERLPAGSFGRAYADFMSSGSLTPEGLVEADRRAIQAFVGVPRLGAQVGDVSEQITLLVLRARGAEVQSEAPEGDLRLRLRPAVDRKAGRSRRSRGRRSDPSASGRSTRRASAAGSRVW